LNGWHENGHRIQHGHPTLGIYRDREFARVKGDPLRTIIWCISQTKEEAEQEASRLGFEEP